MVFPQFSVALGSTHSFALSQGICNFARHSGFGKFHHTQPGPPLFARGRCPKASEVHSLPFFFPAHSQDGEIDLKLLTKVLAPEHEVREVRSGGSACPSFPGTAGSEAGLGRSLAVTKGTASPSSPRDACLGRMTSAGIGTVCTLRCPQSSSASGTCCRRTRRTPWDSSPRTPEPGGRSPCTRSPLLWTRDTGHKPKTKEACKQLRIFMWTIL